MPPLIRKYDELGFPIPATFEDLATPDRDSARPAAAPTRRAGRGKRIVLGLVLLSVIVLAVVPLLKDLGQGLLGDWLAQRARQKFRAGDMEGTVADSTRAFSLFGGELAETKHAEVLSLRAAAKSKLNDLEGSLADFDRLLASPQVSRQLRTECYFLRSWVNCRLKNYPAAISDATEAIDLVGREHPTLLNQRAYIRALANLNKQDLEAGLKDVERAMELSRDNPAFIDTRGYLLHQLGRNDEALRDMDRAIALTLSARDSAYLPEEFKRFKEDMAVMYFHRGLIYQALGRHDEAATDLQEADRLGYNPDAGVL